MSAQCNSVFLRELDFRGVNKAEAKWLQTTNAGNYNLKQIT